MSYFEGILSLEQKNMEKLGTKESCLTKQNKHFDSH